MQRIGLREVVAVTAIFAVGWTLRWWHLGTPSLWWDELVHLSFAAAPDPWAVFRKVQAGIPPGAGNAGAVPLDYMLLNVWTWFVGTPSFEQREAYYRLPSYVWSCATLVALWAYCRAVFGRAVAITATLLLALSVPHVLYAAEARFYSLLMLMSVLNLATFTWVFHRPDWPRAWAAYGVVNVLFFLTGLLSLLVLPWQYLALGVHVLRGGAGRAWLRRAGFLAMTAVLLGGVLLLYFGDVDVGARGIRPGAHLLRVSRLTRRAFDFIAVGDPRQLGLFAWGALVAPLYCLRWRRSMLPVIVTLLVTELVSVPLLVKVLQWKRYYFHPRQALLLLPGLELLAALGLVGTVTFVASWVPPLRGWARGGRAVTAAAVAAVLWFRGPVARDFLVQPHRYFHWTKTERDVKTFARDLRARTAFYRPDEKYLLIADPVGPGSLANPTLARYLRWYGLEDRVVFLGTADLPSVIERLQHGCDDGPCRGHPTKEVAEALRLSSPFELFPPKLWLLGLGAGFGTLGGTVRDIGVLAFPESTRRPNLSTSRLWPYLGMVVAEPR